MKYIDEPIVYFKNYKYANPYIEIDPESQDIYTKQRLATKYIDEETDNSFLAVIKMLDLAEKEKEIKQLLMGVNIR